MKFRLIFSALAIIIPIVVYMAINRTGDSPAPQAEQQQQPQAAPQQAPAQQDNGMSGFSIQNRNNN